MHARPWRRRRPARRRPRVATVASPPAAWMSSTVASAAAVLESTATTLAPSRASSSKKSRRRPPVGPDARSPSVRRPRPRRDARPFGRGRRPHLWTPGTTRRRVRPPPSTHAHPAETQHAVRPPTSEPSSVPQWAPWTTTPSPTSPSSACTARVCRHRHPPGLERGPVARDARPRGSPSTPTRGPVIEIEGPAEFGAVRRQGERTLRVLRVHPAELRRDHRQRRPSRARPVVLARGRRGPRDRRLGRVLRHVPGRVRGLRRHMALLEPPLPDLRTTRGWRAHVVPLGPRPP